MRNSNHDRWVEYSASFALGALDTEEHVAFSEHLAVCAACRAEVGSYRGVAIGLAHTLPVVEPPAALRERILADARKVRPLPASNGERDTTTASSAPTASHRSQPHGRNRSVWLTAAAIAFALVTLAAWMVERIARRELQLAVDALNEVADTNGEHIAALQSAVVQRDSVLAIVLAPDVETARLTASGQPPSARVYVSRERGRVVMIANELPQAPAGRTYQLWAIAGRGAPVSLGTFDSDANGRASLVLPVDRAMRIDVAAVTEEPAGGSPQPTTQPFLVGEIRSSR